MKLNKEQKERCRESADKLFRAFAWTNSDEGDTYWRQMHDKLCAYGKELAKHCETCGHKLDEE